MTLHVSMPQRGARTVGSLADTSPLEQLAVICLRYWARDPVSQACLLARLADGLGAARGRSTLEVMNEMMEVVGRYGRRPFIRHGKSCDCLGADEAVFAGLIEAGVSGDPEDAVLFAGLIVRADMARPLAGLATEFAIALSGILRASSRSAPHLSVVGGGQAPLH